jgi:hypothetical protein
MDATQIAGVIRNPIFKMQYVRFVVGRVFNVYEETDEKYVPLTYTPCLILTSAIKHNRAMSRINYIPIENLYERIQFELKVMDEQDVANEAAAVSNNMLVVQSVNENATITKPEEPAVDIINKVSPPQLQPPKILVEEI